MHMKFPLAGGTVERIAKENKWSQIQRFDGGGKQST